MISLTSPVRTRAQDWPAGAKLAALAVATTGLFLLPGVWPQLAALAGVVLLYALPGRIFLRHGLRQLRPLWPLALVLLVWHGLTGDWAGGFALALRVLSAVALANLVTMTTSLEALREAIHRLLAPLRRIGLPVAILEAAIPLVIRFTPALIGKARQLALAWRARSPHRPGWRVVLPLTLGALDDADRVAEALRARGGLLLPEDR
ncbi:energy-coupling factor transporter transmembrane protein EcfT [Paracoccus yeei]|uniref:Energy-coupling factor transporter transmembrane protein EcfT n=1 Tax=Paracoccus yeei TaxID=147645 RepID=A0A1V0GSQ4_9RHOB|nr:energy-coupling factor transporter transmembrane component T [Paracoccus yeei]ARC36896.1 energy-coupling factor transporter transmembrane protein EcfT [Paracoccus yeei]